MKNGATGWQALSAAPGLFFVLMILFNNRWLLAGFVILTLAVCVWRGLELVRIRQDDAINRAPARRKPPQWAWARVQLLAEFPFMGGPLTAWLDDVARRARPGYEVADAHLPFGSHLFVGADASFAGLVLQRVAERVFPETGCLEVRLSRVGSVRQLERMVMAPLIAGNPFFIRVVVDAAVTTEIEEVFTEVLSRGDHRCQDPDSKYFQRKLSWAPALLGFSIVTGSDLPSSWKRRMTSEFTIPTPSRAQLAVVLMARLREKSILDGIQLDWVDPGVLGELIAEFGELSAAEVLDRALTRYQSVLKAARAQSLTQVRWEAA